MARREGTFKRQGRDDATPLPLKARRGLLAMRRHNSLLRLFVLVLRHEAARAPLSLKTLKHCAKFSFYDVSTSYYDVKYS